MEIPGAGHGFNSRDFEKALKRIRQFLTGEDTTTGAIINGVLGCGQNKHPKTEMRSSLTER
jgi:hypothetical protein